MFDKRLVGLTTAYKTLFVGDTAINFVRTNTKEIYAKATPVVQSSGTEKSRMLTETNLHPSDLGYPPSDLEVVTYFATLSKDNDLSCSVYIAIACFLPAAHTTMLEWLQNAQNENNFNGSELLTHWHELMEPQGPRYLRDQFFSEVVQRANSARNCHFMRRRTETGDPEPMVPDASTFAAWSNRSHAKKATEDLVKFLSTIQPRALCVTYFDEAHELDLCFWVLLRLLQSQESSTRMWYVFIAPSQAFPITLTSDQPSPDLDKKQKEVARLLPPYIALGFDQQMIVKYRIAKTCRMSDAVLSQRLCLDPVLTGSEAIQLADRSVAHHMRLLTGFSDNSEIFYTHSPSEPILVLGSIDILYNTLDAKRLRNVLHTLSRDLCSAGLVEKGVLGELGARTLLLVARDFTAPTEKGRRNLLEPVRLLHFLRTLFGNNVWAGSNQGKFDAAFRNVHVNFTHWMVTKDPIPEANAVFDPSCLSAAVVQVKFKAAGDKKASFKMRSLGIPRDLRKPLPYLALLMELGNESNYQENHSKIISMACKPVVDGEFEELFSHFAAAVKTLHSHRNQERGKKAKNAKETKETKRMQELHLAIDSYNRYSISVRGASPEVYQIIKKADIVHEFATLLDITMPSPKRLGVASSHTAWMTEYVVER
ncbi:hypothetical protein BU17DRAFT_74439 [Hysterangium stoloniferum]|nr:hypothetical protein BU17DRAFT_74439 [Hysterangium stoloniferum]